MDVRAYFDRIGFSRKPGPDIATLRELHRRHMETVPFENLDIMRKIPIVLDEERFYMKIVERRRGGFCYELNGLFAVLLRALGFRVDLLSGRVFSDGRPGPEFDHMALLVHLETRWLADVGFGDSFVEPLSLDDPGEQIQRGVEYRIEKEGEHLIVKERQPGREWSPSYQFSLQPRLLSDFAAMCRWQQTSPDSHFTQKRICSRATVEGRITLSDDKLIVTRHGSREERILDEVEYKRTLREEFGMVVPGKALSP